VILEAKVLSLVTMAGEFKVLLNHGTWEGIYENRKLRDKSFEHCYIERQHSIFIAKVIYY